MLNRAKVNVLTILVLLGFSSCAQNPVMFNKNYDFSKVKRIAVLGFEPYEGIDSSAKAMSVVFEKRLLGAGYQMVERDAVEKILKEQNFQLSGAVDPDQAAKLGKLLGVDALLFGSVTVYSEPQSSVMMVKINSETSEPVIKKRKVENMVEGKKVMQDIEEVVGYTVTRSITDHPQIIKTQAEAGAVVKMVDATTGEIAWVGTETEEGVNTQVAAERVGESIVESLKKFWPLFSQKKT